MHLCVDCALEVLTQKTCQLLEDGLACVCITPYHFSC